MIGAGGVTAIVVTKGDQYIPIVRSHLKTYFEDVHVWDNSLPYGDAKVYGRYALANCYISPSDVVYVQDDDCIVDVPEVLEQYEPGVVTCNIRHTHTDWYTDKFYNVAPVGWGAVFDRDLIQPAFDKYLAHYPKDDFFLRECDRIFTGLQVRSVKRITAGCVNLPWAHGKDRMGAEERHGRDFQEAVRRVQEVLSHV